MRSVALANQKGGVGKTTTAIHLAHGLALRGARVVLVDLDPQGNATVALQGMGDETKGPLRHLGPTFWALSPPADGRPGSSLVDQLRSDIEALQPDWLVADCPPRMDEWGMLGLQLCRQVIVPVQAEFLAMHGLSQIMATIQNAKTCEIAGVLPTMVDAREQICVEVVANLRSHLGSLVFESVILRDSMLVEAASHGRTVFAHASTSVGAFCYGEFLREVCSG